MTWLRAHHNDPAVRRWAIVIVALILILASAVFPFMYARRKGWL